MPASAFRSAWADPEHVRLSMFRSWWDVAIGHVARGPLPPAENPWDADPQTAPGAPGGQQ